MFNLLIQGLFEKPNAKVAAYNHLAREYSFAVVLTKRLLFRMYICPMSVYLPNFKEIKTRKRFI